jgi:glycosyltransferase involved in cell wall biosynthesis
VKLRVAHVSATCPPYPGGTGVVALRNAMELARRGHEAHVFTAARPGAPAEETIGGARVHRLRPWWRRGNAALLPQLFPRLRHFDLIHLHLPFYGGAEAVWALAVAAGIPLVTTYHHDALLPGRLGRLSRRHDLFFSLRLMRLARFACFTSLDYARHCQFAPHAAVLRAVELPNGVDARRFAPGPRDPALAAELGVAGRRTILFVGALDRAHDFKGVDRLLAAVASLARDDLLLIVAGAGDRRDDYRRLARQLGLGRRAVFPGYAPDDRLPDYYRLADVTVLPSTTAGEAFGLVLLESLACATPVIASNLPGVRAVVADGIDGFLVAPGDAADLAARLDQLLGLPEAARRALGAAGRRKVAARYSWERVGDILEALYMEATEPKSAAAGSAIQRRAGAGR